MKIYMEALVYLQNDDYMLKSQEYLEIDNKLEEQKDYIKVERYDDTWQRMNFIYRSYGFLDGLMIGMLMKNNSQEDYYQKLFELIINRI